jgi:hypothetical protein
MGAERAGPRAHRGCRNPAIFLIGMQVRAAVLVNFSLCPNRDPAVRDIVRDGRHSTALRSVPSERSTLPRLAEPRPLEAVPSDVLLERRVQYCQLHAQHQRCCWLTEQLWSAGAYKARGNICSHVVEVFMSNIKYSRNHVFVSDAISNC